MRSGALDVAFLNAFLFFFNFLQGAVRVLDLCWFHLCNGVCAVAAGVPPLVTLRWFCELSHLLVLPCVYVLLVCAEGCTQVTGVMTMMTGRVLLVCALCVLWCGVCAVEVSKADASENTNVFHVPAEGPQPESAGRNTGQQEPLEHVSQERQNAGKPLDPKNEATDDQKRDLEIETPTADELRGEKEEVHKEQIDGGAGREKRKEILEERKAPPDGRGSEGGARQAGKGLAKVGVHSPATTPSGGERPGTSEPSPPESSLPAASTQEPGAAIPASLQEAPAATMKKKRKNSGKPQSRTRKRKAEL